MNDKLNYLSETKSAIKDAISAKGVSVSENDTFRSYADKIKSITSGVTPTGTVRIIQNEPSSDTPDNTRTITVSFPDNVTSISDLSCAFPQCYSVTSVNFNNVVSIGRYGLYSAFSNCNQLTSVNFKNLTSIGRYGLGETFYGCDKLTSVEFKSLTNISEDGLSWTFVSEDPNGGPALSASFPALTSNSFPDGIYVFDRMLMGRGGCTVHFPANLESMLQYYVEDGFSGGDTTVLFDLPATT